VSIPLVDLKAQYLSIKDEIDRAIARVIESSSFILGEEVSSFEKAFAALCRARYAIGVSSGTSALHLALLACEVGPGDEVITTPFTFISTAEVIVQVGARPVFVDIHPGTYNLDPSCLEETITERTRAIIPVHLYGQPADMDSIMEVAVRHGLKVIEDACQAHGAEYKGRRVGSIGDVACFSFYPSKNLGAYGDGGMLVSNSEEIAERVRTLRDHGRKEKYEHGVIGYGYRLDALQAAILKAKLVHLERWNERRRQNAETYRRLLAGLRLVLPEEPSYSRSVYHLFVVRCQRRDDLFTYLASKGIHAGIHYPLPLHLQPCFASLGYRKGDFTKAEEAAEEVLSLPMYPELTEEQMGQVAEAISEFTG